MDNSQDYQAFKDRADIQELIQESFDEKFNMRGSNQFTIEKTPATLFGNRDKDLMEFERKSVQYKHNDLYLDRHTPHMKDVQKMLHPRESEKVKTKHMQDIYSEGHGLSI